jgi:hypothetical protein
VSWIRALAVISVAAMGVIAAGPAHAQESYPQGASAPGQATAPPGAGYAASLNYVQYLQYLALMNAAAAAGSAAPAGSAPDYSQWYTNGAQMTTVPSSGPGAAYYTNGAEVTAYPTAQEATPPPVASAVPAPVPSAAPSAQVVAAPAPSAAPSASALALARDAKRAPAAPSAGVPLIEATPVPEGVNAVLAPAESTPPVAIERPLLAPNGLASNEEPRATLRLAGEGSGVPERGSNLGLVLAALVTGILVGATAVIRFRSSGRGAGAAPGGGATPPV